MQTQPSRLLEQAVNELAKLPGIGRKTALRMALHLLKQTLSDVESLGTALISMRNEVIYCRECRNISDQEVCAICANPRRDHGLVCVVEDIRDVMAIENTSQFNGVYHVLGGIISPVEGIGPRDLHIDHLVGRVAEGSIREVILALPTTIEGDTTSFYLFRKLQGFELQLTTLARGVSIGDELEHTDEVTLGRSIVQRMPYKG
ncbi:MAG TPA: recombination mediator RecR [Bacteroidales bacterium]|nr:recombination mediator RecR [Bacteroidales bacterium]HPS61932.1 recombination mediator RecR [Bacteroidales bacterium]